MAINYVSSRPQEHHSQTQVGGNGHSILRMGNAKSKAGEDQQEEDVATGIRHCTRNTCISDSNNLFAKCVAGQTSGKNVEEYSATLIPVDEQDEANYATEPGT